MVYWSIFSKTCFENAVHFPIHVVKVHQCQFCCKFNVVKPVIGRLLSALPDGVLKAKIFISVINVSSIFQIGGLNSPRIHLR